MIARLLSIEWLKARRRKSFWLIWLGFGVIVALPVWLTHAQLTPSRTGVATSVTWPLIIRIASGQATFLMVGAIALLTASEKGLRTQRQNLIDGLSRTEYFAAKAIGTLVMAVLFLGLIVALGSWIWWIEARAGGPDWASFTQPEHYSLLAGFFLNLLFIGVVTLFFSILCSGVGAALAMSIAFFLLQNIVVASLLTYLGPVWAKAIPYLPARLMAGLSSTLPDAAVSAANAAGILILYLALFAAGGWLLLEKRDA